MTMMTMTMMNSPTDSANTGFPLEPDDKNSHNFFGSMTPENHDLLYRSTTTVHTSHFKLENTVHCTFRISKLPSHSVNCNLKKITLI